MRIHLVGPGGAGKSTVGPILAARLGTSFIDLDRCFTERAGDISDYLRRHGYAAYARRNVEVYRALASVSSGVLALSSGFMTYAPDVHADYAAIREAIARSATTFVLLPSLDAETCIAEIVRRQLQRQLGLVPLREETKIRERFHIYIALPAAKVTTNEPPAHVAEEIASRLQRVHKHDN
jgi:shikimate kinase